MQGAAISASETKIERIEDDIQHKNLALNQQILALEQEMAAKGAYYEESLKKIREKLEIDLSATPTPAPSPK